MNVQEYNSAAWDKLAENGIEWSIPATPETIERARNDDWEVILTPIKPVPREWFGDVKGKNILCLASGGGQQSPILAAAGANVTSFDASAKQLELDKLVANRENLHIRLEKGDAADLSRFADESFDIIFNPCSNCFMANLEPIWRECFRVLRRGGVLLTGFNNPIVYIFDTFAEENEGVLRVKNRLPYSDVESLTEEEKARCIAKNDPFEFSHTLDAQIGGQISAGFLIAGFYEDWWTDEARLLNKFAPTFISTRAIKP
ncbi:MAG TPA: class I SAM-dependent methyltransferase [Pyrinomonadaceae bacterium]|jgi:SAM-dependent methyltransferase